MAFLNKTGVERLWSHVMSRLNNKVDKAEGKALSTNDFTNEEKEKLASIEAGAQVNVQPKDIVISPDGSLLFEDGVNINIGEDQLAGGVILCVQFIDVSAAGGDIQCNMTPEQVFNNPTGSGKLVVYRRIDVINGTESYTFNGERDTNNRTVYIDFADGREPIIVNANDNTIILDPNWVKPVEFVQSDWDQTDEEAADFIKNKPVEATDDEALDMLAEMGVLEAVIDADGAILTDENNNILTI